MTQWYYAKDGERFGPIEFTQLRDLALRGELHASDLVWSEGMQEWAEARTVEGLLEGAPPSAVRPPAPRPSHRSYRDRQQGQTPGVVIAGFIVSLAGLCICAVACPVGAILSYSGLSEAKRRNAGQGLAVAGIVIGIVGTALLVLGILFLVTVSGEFAH